MATVDDIWNALREVMDPEIPTISLVDLGVITDVSIDEEGNVHVRMTPTFTGCPAMEYMRREVVNRLGALGFTLPDVQITIDIPWTTNRISDRGRDALRRHGLAPPDAFEGLLQLDVLNNTACPFCGSRNTKLSSPFGPTLCRSLHYCNDCRQAFEAFKPV